MAQLSKEAEARTWLAEWEGLARGGSSSARRMVLEGAREQRANLEAVKRGGHSGWCDVEEYERAVQMIEAVAADLRRGGQERDALETIRTRINDYNSGVDELDAATVLWAIQEIVDDVLDADSDPE